jgi:ACS family glucarate transporter-like MFS transporter
MALVQGCAVYSQYLFLTWLPSYLQTTKGLDVQSAGIYTAIPYAASVVLALGACYLSDRRVTPEGLARGQRGRMVALMLLCSSVVLLAPLVDSIGAITLLVTLSLTGISSAISLNFALASDLSGSSQDIGKVASLLVFGGNMFGLLAPIVTGYVIAGTGSYNWAFGIAGILLLVGATTALTLARGAGSRV